MAGQLEIVHIRSSYWGIADLAGYAPARAVAAEVCGFPVCTCSMMDRPGLAVINGIAGQSLTLEVRKIVGKELDSPWTKQ